MIGLKDGDEVVGARSVADDDDLVFIASDGQLLRFGAAAVRPQGRAAGGMAGVRLGGDAEVVFFGVVPAEATATVVTISGSSSALPGTEAGSVKVTDFAEYPPRGAAPAACAAIGSSRAKTP